VAELVRVADVAQHVLVAERLARAGQRDPPDAPCRGLGDQAAHFVGRHRLRIACSRAVAAHVALETTQVVGRDVERRWRQHVRAAVRHRQPDAELFPQPAQRRHQVGFVGDLGLIVCEVGRLDNDLERARRGLAGRARQLAEISRVDVELIDH